MPTVDGYLQARWYTPGSRRKTMVVIHTMEAPQSEGRARNTAHYFSTTSRKASTQFSCDNKQVWQSLDIATQMPYGAGFGSNRDGIHIENPGYAAFTRDQWLTPYGHDNLRILARLVNELCAEYDIPKRMLRLADLKAGNRSGITYHKTLSLAAGSGHTDPGPNWPEDVFLGYLGASGPVVIGMGRSNDPEAVRSIQRQMAGLGLYEGPIDGIYGEGTNHAVWYWKKFYLGIGDNNGDWTEETFVKTVAWVRYIESVSADAPAEFQPLGEGRANNVDHVTWVQRFLSGVSAYEGDANGEWTRDLTDAVKRWQEFVRVGADGVWGEHTAAATYAWLGRARDLLG